MSVTTWLSLNEGSVKNKSTKRGFNFGIAVPLKKNISTSLTCIWEREKMQKEENNGESVVLPLIKCLENTHCIIFWQFLQKSCSYCNVLDKNVDTVATDWKSKKGMPEMTC